MEAEVNIKETETIVDLSAILDDVYSLLESKIESHPLLKLNISVYALFEVYCRCVRTVRHYNGEMITEQKLTEIRRALQQELHLMYNHGMFFVNPDNLFEYVVLPFLHLNGKPFSSF